MLQYYTPVKSYYRLMKITLDDPKFDRKKAMKRLINFAVKKCLAEMNCPYKALIAFSGTNSDFGHELTSSGLNDFPDSKMPERFRDNEYRLLIVADMFQTGFDEPLLYAMYIDKEINGVKAVQTLSRLNRTYSGKSETFILDFANDAGIIADSFSRYYKTAILSGETEPNE